MRGSNPFDSPLTHKRYTENERIKLYFSLHPAFFIFHRHSPISLFPLLSLKFSPLTLDFPSSLFRSNTFPSPLSFFLSLRGRRVTLVAILRTSSILRPRTLGFSRHFFSLPSTRCRQNDMGWVDSHWRRGLSGAAAFPELSSRNDVYAVLVSCIVLLSRMRAIFFRDSFCKIYSHFFNDDSTFSRLHDDWGLRRWFQRTKALLFCENRRFYSFDQICIELAELASQDRLVEKNCFYYIEEPLPLSCPQQSYSFKASTPFPSTLSCHVLRALPSCRNLHTPPLIFW